MSREFKCKKCECTDVYIKWGGISDRLSSTPYVLEIKCTRCGYFWEETTSDKKVSNEQANK